MTVTQMTEQCLIVEPATVDREGLRAFIDRAPDLELLAEAHTAEEATSLAIEPRVVLVGLVSCEASEIEIVDTLRARFPEAGMLVLAHEADLETIRSLMSAGVGGYVSKSAEDAELVRAVRSVAHGMQYLDPSLGAAFAGVQPRAYPDGPLRDLSRAEIDVLRLLALGYTNAEIAQLLTYSVRSIEARRAQIQRKLDTHSRAELVRLALDNGLIEPTRTTASASAASDSAASDFAEPDMSGDPTT